MSVKRELQYESDCNLYKSLSAGFGIGSLLKQNPYYVLEEEIVESNNIALQAAAYDENKKRGDEGNSIDKAILCKLVYLAYYANDLYSLRQKIEELDLKEDWVPLFTSAENSNYSYKAIAFFNEKTKEIVFANAGTDTTDPFDFADDLMLACGFVPNKISDIKSFVNLVEHEIIGLENYTLHCTGHSLGGVLSDLMALELKSRGFQVEDSITFENPGSKASLDRAISNGLFSGSLEIDLTETTFSVFNALPNIINTSSAQLDRAEIAFILKKSKAKVGFKSEEKTDGSFFSSLYSTASNAISNIKDSLYSYLGVDRICEVLDDHSLDPFIKHFSSKTNKNSTTKEVPTKSWYSSEKQHTVLAYNEALLSKIRSVKQTAEASRDEFTEKAKASAGEFVMHVVDAKNELVEIIRLSLEELQESFFGSDLLGEGVLIGA